MTYRHTCVWHILVYKCGNLGKVAYAVVYKVDLTIARHFKVYGIGYYLMTIYANFGLYWISVRWRRAYDAHITCAHKRELQGSGYWCCRHCQGVNITL